MTKQDWDVITSYIDSVGSTNKTVTFQKAQDTVKVTNKGNVNLTYTIGTQSGTLAPSESKKVTENLSSFIIRADSGAGEFEVWSTEAGTEKEEISTGIPADIAVQLNQVKTDLAQKATKAEVQAVASGSPKGTYATLSALQTAKPSGDTNIYVVTADGNWYYWNGTAWTAGGVYQTTIVKDGVNAENLIKNGNFVNTTNWDAVSGTNGTLAASNNELIYTIVGLVSSSRIQQSIYTPVVGHKYFVRGDIYPKYANTSYIAFGGPTVTITPTANAWNTIKGIVTASNTSQFKLYHPTNSGYGSGDTFKFRNMLVVDLTAIYGAGNEPDNFESVLSKYPNSWFDGTVQIAPPQYLTDAFEAKVDKTEGKGLSTNDYTDSDKAVVQSISNKTIITVKADGTGDYTSLRQAMESTSGATKDNQYEVQIEEGTYDLMTMYTQAEIENVSFVGFVVPNYVSLVGTGQKDKTIIKMEIPDTWLAATIARVAPIAYQGNGGMQNLTVIGKNCRYTIHDDYGYPDAKKLIKNCTFKKLAGLGNSQAWGEGSFSGMEFIFEDVEFITEFAQASYSTHNNTAFAKPTYHKFKNCKFINSGGYFGIRFITLNSGQLEKVDMEGCYIDGIIKFEEYEAGVGCRYEFKMYGCTEVPLLIDATDGSQPTYTVNEETKLMKNAESTVITKGTPVKLNNDGSVIQKFGTNPITLLYGIAMQDIQPSATGMIKTKGYLPVVDTGLTLVTGDKVGIVDGALVKVTSGEYIGVVTRSGFIKLKF